MTTTFFGASTAVPRLEVADKNIDIQSVFYQLYQVP